jgi:hypothetical protein
MYGGRASVTSQPPLSAASYSNLLCLFLSLFVFCCFYKLLLNKPPWGMKHCYKGLNKQSSGVRERIIHFTLILMGKWFRFSNKSASEQPLGTNYVREQRFHCILIFKFLDSRREEKRFWTEWWQALVEGIQSPLNFLLN